MARTIEKPLTATEPGSGDRRRWLVLVAMVFGLFMPMLDNLVVNVALPTIQHKLGAGVSGLQWIIDAYTLTFASFMLTGGALGDLYGRKRFFMMGLIVFVAGSLLCGLSGSTGELIGFRALQGLGAAMLLPGSLSIITATFTGKERGAAIGIWAAMSGLAIAIGPVIGGYLVEHVSWQSIFFINVPIGIFGLALTWFVVTESKDTSKSRRLDPPGLVTGTAGLFFLVYALIEGNARGWMDPQILGSFVLAAILLANFLRIESRRESPMLPLHFFKIPTFAASNGVAAAIFFAMFGTIFYLTLYLQNILHYSPEGAGLRLFAFSVVMLIVAPTVGRLSDRFGSRGFMTAGPLIAAVGMLLLTRTQVDSSYWSVLLPAFLVLATGMAMTMTPMTAAVMASVPPQHAGVASAATNTSRELGGVFGIALLGAVVTNAFTRAFQSDLVARGFAPAVASKVAEAGGNGFAAGAGTVQQIMHAVPGITTQQAQAVVESIQQAFVHSMHIGMLVAVAFQVLAGALGFFFVRSHVGIEHPSADPAVPVAV
jgi:EmrB/QacA subfamily drug resistance transporter